MIDRKPFRPRTDAAPPERLAAAPISWGVCEVPGWCPQLSAADALGEMRAFGLRAGRVDLREATRLGVFVPLGEGDARVEDVIRALEDGGYPGWYVLEQDTIADRGAESPTRDARRSVEFVRGLDAGPGFAGRGAGREVTGSKP